MLGSIKPSFRTVYKCLSQGLRMRQNPMGTSQWARTSGLWDSREYCILSSLIILMIPLEDFQFYFINNVWDKCDKFWKPYFFLKYFSLKFFGSQCFLSFCLGMPDVTLDPGSWSDSILKRSKADHPCYYKNVWMRLLFLTMCAWVNHL